MKILLAGGGTLGSTSPLIAIYQESKKQGKKWSWVWVGTKNGIEKTIVRENSDIKYFSIPTAKLRRYFSIKNFLTPFLFLYSFLKSFFIIFSENPDIVISAGSFVSVPCVWAAKILKKKIIIHQLDIVPTLSNKLCAKFADKITVTFEKSISDFSSKKTEATGNPIRIFDCCDRKIKNYIFEKYNFDPNLPCLLVMGGSSGSEAMNEWVLKNSGKFLGKANIIHITGKNKNKEFLNHKNIARFEFLGKDMFSVISLADLVITRAGISALTELSFLGAPCVCVPMPSSHQEINAEYFEKQNATMVIKQQDFISFGAEKILETLNSKEKLKNLSDNIKKIAPSSARERLVEILIEFEKSIFSKNRKHVFLIGIGGISVSGIAKLFLKKGAKVSGYDEKETDITRELVKLGADIYLKGGENELPLDVDALIYSEAVPKENAFRKKARERGVIEYSGAEFWGEFSKDKKVLAVSGTNGKSTTTAFLGYILEKAGFDPTVAVGTKVLQWNSNIRLGKSKWFVIEADEYAAKMMKYKPEIAIITNIAPDHLDFYKNTDDIINHFQAWINQMSKDAIIVVNRDDENSKKLDFGGRRVIKFGIGGTEGIRTAGLTVCSPDSGWIGKNGFNIIDQEDWGYTRILVPGMKNIENSLAASCAAVSSGVKKDKILKAISEFKGTWRRFEMVGEYNESLVVSDYAHHPDGIKSAIEAARGWYPFEKIIAVFQPHHRNRTKNLFTEFSKSFSGADKVIIQEIFDVSGRENQEDANISSKDLCEEIKKNGIDAIFTPNAFETEKEIKKNVEKGNIILIMGAGDIDTVARNLVFQKQIQ